MASIQGIYVALFGRPADPLGLAFFTGETNGGQDLTAIGDLASTAEYQSRFEGVTHSAIINKNYQDLFNRDADVEGLTFFTTALATGQLSINNIAIAIFDGAQNDDIITRDNKVAAADMFTASLDTGTEIVAYQGEVAAQQGRAFLAPVGLDPDTIPTQAETDMAVQAVVDGDVGSQIFMLTTDANNFTGTAGDDTFRAIAANSLGTEDSRSRRRRRLRHSGYRFNLC